MDTIWKIYNRMGSTCRASQQIVKHKKPARLNYVTGMKVAKLTTYAQLCFTRDSAADKINAATLFKTTEILGISKYIVHLILSLNDMNSLVSSSEEK